jgi:hypothetical protein
MRTARKDSGYTSFCPVGGRDGRMPRDARSSRIGRLILLVALAIQGVTPDPRSLASPRLFRILTWELADLAFGQDPDPPPIGDRDENPSDVCSPSGMHEGPRLSRDPAGRPGAEITSNCSCGRLLQSSILSFHAHILAMQGGDDRILALCRFRC